MGRRPSGKTQEQKREELRRYNREYMRHYRELHHDELCAKRREKYKENKLQFARTASKYWNKRLEELENQKEEA